MPIIKRVPHKTLPGWETITYSDGMSANRKIVPVPFTKTPVGNCLYWLVFCIVGMAIAAFALRYLAGMML